MLTRRKKQNILFFAIGFFSGILIMAGIAYFGVVKQFTKKNIGKFQHYATATIEKDTAKVETKIVNVKKTNFKNQDAGNNNTLSDFDSDSLLVAADVDTYITEEDSTSKNNEDVVKSDIKITSMIMAIVYQADDSSMIADEPYTEILVEQWENPTHFSGYKKSEDLLIIYGINIDDIDLVIQDGLLFLLYGAKKIEIKETETFVRFPLSFLHK